MITTNFSLRRGAQGRGVVEGREGKYCALIDYTNLLFLNGLTLSGVLLSRASYQIHIPVRKEA